MRHRLQFRLRSLLFFLTAIGVLLGIKVNEARRQRESIAHLKSLGAHLIYAHQSPDGRYDHPWKPQAEPMAPRWLRSLLGDEYFVRVTGVTMVNCGTTNSSDFAALANLLSLRTITIAGGQGGSESVDVRRLHSLRRLERLRLFGVQVDDRALAALARLPDLDTLHLASSRITDAGAAQLANFPRLTTLDLSSTRITDDGLRELTRLKRLKSLKVSFTQVTDDGIEAFNRAVPNCVVTR